MQQRLPAMARLPQPLRLHIHARVQTGIPLLVYVLVVTDSALPVRAPLHELHPHQEQEKAGIARKAQVVTPASVQEPPRE